MSLTIKRILLGVFSGALLLSCETVVDIDVPIDPPKPVVFGTFNNLGDWNFSVTKSMHILDIQEFATMYDNAIITVYEGETKLFVVPPDGMEGYYYYSGPLQSGKEYKISVAVPNMELATSSAIMPEVPVIVSAKYDSTKFVINEFGYLQELTSVEVVFEDNPNMADYYTVSLEGFMGYEQWDPNIPPSDSTWQTLYVSLNDPVMSDGEEEQNTSYLQKVTFSDALINGKQYTLKFGINQWDIYRIGKIRVRFSSIGKSGYLFNKSVKEQQMASDDPFSEPVNVHSNISNGYGAFYGINTDTLLIKVN